MEIKTTGNEPSAEQCGQFPETGIRQTYKRWWKAKEITSKPRNAAAGRPLRARQKKYHLK